MQVNPKRPIFPSIGKGGFNFSNVWKPDRVRGMKRVLSILLLTASVYAEDLPSAPQILAAARAQLPPHPVVMTGVLKQWAANGFMKKAMDVEMTLDWSASPPQAEYRISDPKKDFSQTLKIIWNDGNAEFSFSQNGEKKAFNSHNQIQNSGISWDDLSFSFLWNEDARTIGTDKKLGKECFLISVPRPAEHELLLWVEKETGRMLGAEEHDADGNRIKIIKVVSVKKFDELWMVKDLDIIQPGQDERTSLRVDHVEARP